MNWRAPERRCTTSSATEVRSAAVDLAAADGPAELARRAADAFGGLDILVNNAGISHPQPVTETDPELFDATLAVNLRAPALLAAASRS